MNLARPTPQQERWLTVAARLGATSNTTWLLERSGGWKTVSILTRCAFFVLGVVAAALAAAFCWSLHLPVPMAVAGIVSIVAGETLITKRKFFGVGIEEGLEVTGLILIIAQVMDSTDTYNETTLSLWIAIGMALVGIRLLNALITTAAAVVLSFTVYSTITHSGSTGLYEYQSARTLAGAFCFAIATATLVASAKQFRRPSIDRMLDWLVIAMPVVGYFWLLRYNPTGLTLPILRNNTLAVLPLAAIVLFGVAALVIGLQRRRHAPVFAAMLSVGCVAYELRSITGLALELRLILWGSVALLVTLGLIAYLREPRNGITSNEIASGPEALSLLELAGVSSLTPAASTAKPDYQGAGGSFGGGGASGKY